jgi:Raf kinase inhibitor-like YbhB/YbcL family protein
MYDIPASVGKLPPGAGDPAREWMPGVTQGRTDFGKRGYGGPCPPKGDPAHHYVFTVHALDVEKLDVPADATAAAIGFNINAHRLASAALTGVYGR